MCNYKLALKFYKKMVDYLKDDISSMYLYCLIYNSYLTNISKCL